MHNPAQEGVVQIHGDSEDVRLLKAKQALATMQKKTVLSSGY